MITQKYLQSILEYNPDTGIFTWKIDVDNNVKYGNTAGNVNNKGYMRIAINKKSYLAHRLAWLYVYGEFPLEQIDHTNHDRTDNRIDNLRCVSNQENAMNASKRKDNKSGTVGVSWYNRYNKWVVQIKANNKRIHLGYFTDINDAIAARKQAEIKYGYHKNHGKTIME